MARRLFLHSSQLALRVCADQHRFMTPSCMHVLAYRTYMDFLRKVAAGRRMTVEEVRKVAKGRVWTGQDAHERGLVDVLGGIRDAVGIAKREAGLSEV